MKDDLLDFLIEQKRRGKKVAGYGAAAKGNTLLNYAGVKPDLLSFICDAALSKQGKFMPGSHIPILTPQAMQERRPDFVVILPWNLADEIVKSNAFIREWGGKFVKQRSLLYKFSDESSSTGASGHIGRHCLEQLLIKGYEVHAVSSIPQPNKTGVQWHQVNLLDTCEAKALIRAVKPSHLLHFAWCTEHGRYWTAEENLNWINASFALMNEFAASNGKRFVAAGTCAEYDWSNELCSEFTTACRPATLYGAAKYSTHLLLEAWAKQTGLSSAWGRILCMAPASILYA